MAGRRRGDQESGGRVKARAKYSWEKRMESPRRPPVNEVFKLHLPRQPGKCDWCGQPHDERTPVRKQLKARHAECESDYLRIIRPELARAAVEERDHGICAQCGEDWSLMSRFAPEFRHPDRSPMCSTNVEGWGRKDELRIRFTPILVISLWHVDHKVPLWKVRHMPPVERLEYWRLPNLQTLCDPCHKRKTAAEAAERSHYDALAGRARQEPLPW